MSVYIFGILGSLATIFGLYLLAFPAQKPIRESNLDASIFSIYVKEKQARYPGINVYDIFNPETQGMLGSGLFLWLENKEGETTIYTQTISVLADGFWTSLIEKQDYEIKPDQVIKIPINFTPRDKNIKRYHFYAEIEITYRTNGKELSKRLYQLIRLSSSE